MSEQNIDTLLALQLASGDGTNIEVVKKELDPQEVNEFELFSSGLIRSIRIEGEGDLFAELIVDGKVEYQQSGEGLIYNLLGLPIIPEDPTLTLEVTGDVEFIRVMGIQLN